MGFALMLMAFLTIASPLLPNLYAQHAPAGKLIFHDDFERNEPVAGQEEVGNSWTTNSAWRADGNQQVDLIDGKLCITRYKTADHGVGVFHDIAFQDGSVELSFSLDEGSDLNVDFVDRQLKTVHAGHLCIVKITPRKLTLADSKTGVMDLNVREQRALGETPELKKFLASKSKEFPLSLEPESWHVLRVVIEGDVMTAFVDEKEIGSLKSEGIAHPTKRGLTLGVNRTAKVDDLSVWDNSYKP